MRLYKRSNTWWVSYRADGRTVRRSTGYTDKAAATAEARRLERHQAGATAHKTALADALAAWRAAVAPSLAPSTVRGYDLHIRHLARLLGEVALSRLTRATVREYLGKRTTEGAHSHTLHKELVVLRQTLAHAQDAGQLPHDPGHYLPRWKANYRPRDRWLTRDEVAKLAAQLEPHRALWVWVAVYTGARYGELSRLTWADFDLERARVHIRGTKTAQSDRHLPIPAALVELLRAQPEPHAGPVLVRWDCSSSRESLLRAAERAGIPRLTLHDLRRTYASWAVQADLGSSKVAALLGHTSTQMVDRVYAHLAPGHLAEAVERMEGVQIRHSEQAEEPEEPETGPDWAREP